MDSRFKKGVDPIRNPKTQKVIESTFKENYSKVLKLMVVKIAQVLKKN